jgi:hypothetical protein
MSRSISASRAGPREFASKEGIPLTDEIVAESFKVVQDNPEGFSYKPETRTWPEDGYMCSIYDRDKEFPVDANASVTEQARGVEGYLRENWKTITGDKDLYLGGWLRTQRDDGTPVNEYVLDVSRNIPGLEDAMRLAIKNRQSGIYWINKGKTIYVDAWQKEHPDFKGVLFILICSLLWLCRPLHRVAIAPQSRPPFCQGGFSATSP